MLRPPLLTFLADTIVQDQHPLAMESMDDRLEHRIPGLKHRHPADPAQHLPQSLHPRFGNIPTVEFLTDRHRMLITGRAYQHFL